MDQISINHILFLAVITGIALGWNIYRDWLNMTTKLKGKVSVGSRIWISRDCEQILLFDQQQKYPLLGEVQKKRSEGFYWQIPAPSGSCNAPSPSDNYKAGLLSF